MPVLQGRVLGMSVLLAFFGGGSVGAQANMMAPDQGEESCAAFLPQAERHYAIPTGLLSAIAMTESGLDGRPHPWALNLAGQARMAESYAEAASLLRRHDGTPRQDLAVGCMQIYMRYHLDSIETPEWVLRPRNNVWYAAAFLRRLYDQYGSWRLAVGHYNASDPAAQNIYRCQVARSLARIAPETAAALSMPSACGTIPRRAFPLIAGEGGKGWGRVVVGRSLDGTESPAGRVVSVGQVVRSSPAKAARSCAPQPLSDKAVGAVIIRAGQCGAKR